MVYKIIKGEHGVFFETLLITLVILLIGFFVGFFVEEYRTGKIADSYNQFDINSTDLRLQNYYYQIMSEASCDKAIKQNFIFADEIYETGLVLEKYEQASELSKDLLIQKKRYVLLKTELWLNSILLKEKCKKPFDTVVYIYSQTPNSIKKAEQDSVSNTLRELKDEMKNQIILIPIAGDLGLEIVNLQLDVYNITYFPSVIINENYTLEGFHSLNEIKAVLNKA